MAREETTVRRRRRAQAADQNAPEQTADSTSATEQTSAAAPAMPNFRESLRQIVMRLIMMYAFYHYYIKPKADQHAPKNDAPKPIPTDAPANPLASMLGMPSGPTPGYYQVQLNCAWRKGIPLSAAIYVSEQPDMSFVEMRALGNEHAIWSAHSLTFDTDNSNRLMQNVTLKVPESVRERNGTWFAHVFVMAGNMYNMEPERITESMIKKYVLQASYTLASWRKVDLNKEAKNLLDESGDGDKDENSSEEDGANGEKEEEKEAKFRYDQVWTPILPVYLVVTQGAMFLKQLPENAAKLYRVAEEERLYYPPMEVSEFWILKNTLPLMNETVTDATVEVSFTPISMYKWSMLKSFENTWEKQIEMGLMPEEQREDLKSMIIETNPVLLVTTMFVSTAHTVLETLAFKNDISHWKNIKSLEGVSVRSMIWKIIMEAIIFLYLWDNDTSWLISIGNGVGLAIAIWKLGKAVKFENFGSRKLLGFIPWFEMSDRESYSKETKEYDDQAMKYLSYAVYPLVIGYALYSLKYEKHKSWYSWIISSLVGAVYAFGFIMMFPQIFINYKLKSVAHMPMKAMMYKTLNTIIDDLFSFIIKMPWLHRLACFRDDVVFLIILYQRWIYPVDKSRVNEFGQVFEEKGDEKKTDGSTPRSNAESSGNQDESTPSTGVDEISVAKESESISTDIKSVDEKKND